MLTVLDEALFRAGGSFELAAAVGVADGDVQGGLGGRARCAGYADAAADKRAQHGEEAGILGLDRGGVLTLLIDIGEAVEQVLAWHADVVEAQGAIVHTHQTTLVAMIAQGDAW